MNYSIFEIQYGYPLNSLMSEQIPVTPDTLKWARERSGFDIGEISEKFPKINEWEKGDSYPTYKQLEKLSTKYKCPIAVFFFPEPPKIEPIEKSFRTLPETEFQNMPPKIRILLHKAKSMQMNLNELNDGKNPIKKQIINDLNFSIDTPIENAAQKVRNYLKISLAQQASWDDTSKALDSWRNILTEHGIFIFKDAFKSENFSGFCLYDNKFPIIYINNSASKTRQIFTMFHELGHLLFHTSGINTEKDKFINNLEANQKKIEVFCNKFSGAFLVPDNDFEKSISSINIDKENIDKLSKKYSVSREVILRKFLDQNLISQSCYNKKSKEWATPNPDRGSGGNYYFIQINYLGDSYINLALAKCHRNQINVEQASDYLNIKPKNFTKFEDNFIRRGM